MKKLKYGGKKMSELLDKKKCPYCGKKMAMAIDSITGKKSKYLWECKCAPNMQISIG